MEFLRLPLRKAKLTQVTQAQEGGSLASGAPLSFGRYPGWFIVQWVGVAPRGCLFWVVLSRGWGAVVRCRGSGRRTYKNPFQAALGQALDPRQLENHYSHPSFPITVLSSWPSRCCLHSAAGTPSPQRWPALETLCALSCHRCGSVSSQTPSPLLFELPWIVLPLTLCSNYLFTCLPALLPC